MKQLDIEGLQEVFNENLDLFLFYVTWVKNGLNAGRAYKELHPSVSEHSARTLGSRLLTKVDKALVMQAYGLDLSTYYNQLKDGLNAMKRDQFSGEIAPDHQTRKPYHDKLGKQLGIETEATSLTQINVEKGNEITFVNFAHESES